MPTSTNHLPRILRQNEQELVREWLSAQVGASGAKFQTVDEKVLASTAREFLALLATAVESGDQLEGKAWAEVRQFLTNLSASRAKEGFTSSATALFVFSLKEPLFKRLQAEIRDPQTLADEIWSTTQLLDKLGLQTVEAFQRTREETISRQQQELLELSTPVVQLWDNVLALPLIGTLDSTRTQVVMQNLLEAIVATRSDIAIIDITGVPVVDTLVAQHLLRTVAAARLMGADCIISGIRPQIAQTIIHLGVDLSEVTTKATMASAFQVALQRTGSTITKHGAALEK